MARDNFDAAAVATELVDGDGAVLLKGGFDKDRIARVGEPIVAETDLDRDTASPSTPPHPPMQ